MKSYTFTMKATVSFDIEAETEKEARANARGTADMLRGGLPADELMSKTTSGYVVANPRSRAVRTDTYDLEK
jgi:hypothetical protein